MFNASDDTVDMMQKLVHASGEQTLISCRFADLKKGIVDLEVVGRPEDLRQIDAAIKWETRRMDGRRAAAR